MQVFMRVFLCCLLLACSRGFIAAAVAVVCGGKRSAGGAPES
jgi:hypothetical protein